VDETEQIQILAEPDQSDEARRTRVWRFDQFVARGFDFARAALMADDSRIDLARARRLVASGRVGRRNSRLTRLALEHAGELTHRPRGDQLDRDAIRAQCLRQPLGISTVPEQD
jgi:hypothetical protein